MVGSQSHLPQKGVLNYDAAVEKDLCEAATKLSSPDDEKYNRASDNGHRLQSDLCGKKIRFSFPFSWVWSTNYAMHQEEEWEIHDNLGLGPGPKQGRRWHECLVANCVHITRAFSTMILSKCFWRKTSLPFPFL